MANPFNLKVGSPVWCFSRGDTPATLRITAETSRSWVLADEQKIPKTHASPVFDVSPSFGPMRRYCLTHGAADAMFLERARWRMAEAVKTCTGTAMLRAVAAALGMPTGVESSRPEGR